MEKKDTVNPQDVENEEKKEVTVMGEAKKATAEETKKEKKPGKVRSWIKRHKRELITGAASFAAGAGGAIGISELGRRHQMKKAARTYIPAEQVNPLDPNL
jgi:hypothetical protein